MGKTVIQKKPFLSIDNNLSMVETEIPRNSTYTIPTSGYYWLKLQTGQTTAVSDIIAKVNGYVILATVNSVAYNFVGEYFYFEKGTIISIEGGTSTSGAVIRKIN